MKKILAALLAATLVACSGGGSGTKPCSGSSCTSSATSLVVALSKTQLQDIATDSVTVTVTAVDANNNAVSGATVQVVPTGAVYVPTSTTTDSSGKISGKLSVSADRTNHDVTIAISSGSVTTSATLKVVGAQLSATAADAVVAPGGSTNVTYTLLDAVGSPISGAEVVVSQSSGTVGQTGSTATDSNGHYVYTFVAPSTTGQVTVNGAVGDSSVSNTITVSSGTVIPPVTIIATTTSLAASPSVVSVNTANSTANQVELRALFLGASNQAIPNIRVRFDLADDPGTIGGTITSAGSIVYSDSNGVARTQYIPGTRATGPAGLTVRACWDYADFADVGPTGTCPSGHTLTTVVTISNQPLSLSAFTNLKITINEAKTTYSMPLTVQVTDSAGHPKSGVQVSYSSRSLYYYKGFYSKAGGATAWFAVMNASCPSEDIQGTGIYAAWEDANNSLALEPRQSYVTMYPSATGSDVTDASGKAYFTLEWGQSASFWNDVSVNFAATVDGSEGRFNYYLDHLPTPASAITDLTGAPPFVDSPYGANGPGTTIQITDPRTGTLAVDPVLGGTANFCTDKT